MDLFSLGSVSLSWQFLSALFSIIAIDLVLAGDNAVVIAMAVRSLPETQRRKGIVYGAAAAVLLRVIATFFIARLLTLHYVKLCGGIVILWIAVKLFAEDEKAAEGRPEAISLWHAVRLIVIADLTMALDNMLAVGGASQGNFFLLFFGLALTIPFIVFASSLLSRLMEQYPVIIYIGAAILGKVAGQMIMTDPAVARLFLPGKGLLVVIEVLFAAAVIVLGLTRVKAGAARQPEPPRF